jgi:hypothetical protein
MRTSSTSFFKSRKVAFTAEAVAGDPGRLLDDVGGGAGE